MNKDNAAQFLPLVQALADGKTIECEQIGGGWAATSAPNFNEFPSHYRIKPEPREWIGIVTETTRDHDRGNRDFTVLIPDSRGCLPELGKIKLREILD